VIFTTTNDATNATRHAGGRLGGLWRCSSATYAERPVIFQITRILDNLNSAGYGKFAAAQFDILCSGFHEIIKRFVKLFLCSHFLDLPRAQHARFVVNLSQPTTAPPPRARANGRQLLAALPPGRCGSKAERRRCLIIGEYLSNGAAQDFGND
jgi:hypothetical protein